MCVCWVRQFGAAISTLQSVKHYLAFCISSYQDSFSGGLDCFPDLVFVAAEAWLTTAAAGHENCECSGHTFGPDNVRFGSCSLMIPMVSVCLAGYTASMAISRVHCAHGIVCRTLYTMQSPSPTYMQKTATQNAVFASSYELFWLMLKSFQDLQNEEFVNVRHISSPKHTFQMDWMRGLVQQTRRSTYGEEPNCDSVSSVYCGVTQLFSLQCLISVCCFLPECSFFPCPAFLRDKLATMKA